MKQMKETISCDNQDLDSPGTTWDYLLLGVAVAASIPYIAANLAILVNRRRPYFRAQGGSFLIVTGSAAGLSWIGASFVINFHFRRSSFEILLLCSVWTFWIFLTFGFCLWLVCLILRLFRLFRLSSSASYPRSPWTLLYILVLWAPSITFALVGTKLKAITHSGEGDCRNCEMTEKWKICSFLILPLTYFTILLILLFHCRNSKDYLMASEYSHTSEYSLMAFIIYLLYGIDILTGSYRKVSGRCFSTFCVCSVIFFDFWVRMGWPVYLCLFKDASEMDKFEEKLYSCGSECLRRLDATTNSSQTSPSPPQDTDWILKAIDMAMHEALEYKDKINQLEQKRNILSSKIKELEAMTTGSMSSLARPKDIQSNSAKDLKSFSYSKIP